MSARSGAPRAPPALLQLMGRLLVGRAQEAHRHLQPQVAKARAKTKERRDAVLTDERKDRCRIKVPMCNPTRMPWCGRSCAPSTFFGIFFFKKKLKKLGGVASSFSAGAATKVPPTPYDSPPDGFRRRTETTQVEYPLLRACSTWAAAIVPRNTLSLDSAGKHTHVRTLPTSSHPVYLQVYLHIREGEEGCCYFRNRRASGKGRRNPSAHAGGGGSCNLLGTR